MEKEYYIVNGKKIDIVDENWNFLVILDACRYDIFKKNYKNFFSNGDLYKAFSPATSTGEWYKKIFKKKIYEDFIYLNTNPKVNIHKKRQGFEKYKKQFFHMENIWEYAWDESYCTVHPKEVNKTFNRFYLKYPNKRFILHYLQPHAPYIINNGAEMKLDNDIRKWISNEKLLRNIERISRMGSFWRIGYIWKFLKFFNISSHKPLGKAWYINGDELLKKNYERELVRVLLYVKNLVDFIKGKWIITSDHGERLGENNKYSHGGPRDKEVIEVPWLVIRS